MISKFFETDFQIIYDHMVNVLYICKKPRKASLCFAKLEEEIKRNSQSDKRFKFEKMKTLLSKDIMNYVLLNYPLSYLKFSMSLDFYIVPICSILILMVHSVLKYLYGFVFTLAILGIVLFLIIFKACGDSVIRWMIQKSVFYKFVKGKKVIYSD